MQDCRQRKWQGKRVERVPFPPHGDGGAAQRAGLARPHVGQAGAGHQLVLQESQRPLERGFATKKAILFIFYNMEKFCLFYSGP